MTLTVFYVHALKVYFNLGITFFTPAEDYPDSVNRRLFLCIAAALVILMSIVRMIIELFYIYKERFHRFTKWVTWLEVVLFPCSTIFVAMPNWICPCVFAWQWQVGVVAVFLAWADLTAFTSKLPYVGIYVLMLSEILKTFTKLVLLTLLLITTFGISFFMIFSDPSVQVCSSTAFDIHGLVMYAFMNHSYVLAEVSILK